MPVDRLLVEGDLDAQIMNALCGGNPVVRPARTKFGLGDAVQALQEHAEMPVLAVRDRDFDSDPAADTSQPGRWTRRRSNAEIHLGYYWSRHEIENYLLLPDLVEAAMKARVGWQREDYERALREAGKSILYYEAARWALGMTRRSLPVRLPSRYDDGHEYGLPPDPSESSCRKWVLDTGKAFLGASNTAVSEAKLDELFGGFRDRFAPDAFYDTSGHLLWFSGKDLLSALQPWMVDRRLAGDLYHWVRRVRDWVIDNPDEARCLVPEWGAIVTLLRG